MPGKPNASKDMQWLERAYTAGGDVKLYKHFGNCTPVSLTGKHTWGSIPLLSVYTKRSENIHNKREYSFTPGLWLIALKLRNSNVHQQEKE